MLFALLINKGGENPLAAVVGHSCLPYAGDQGAVTSNALSEGQWEESKCPGSWGEVSVPYLYIGLL